jgi:hypothetical protein
MMMQRGYTGRAGAPSCAEFWINRYQGLLGAFATLCAGFLAYRAAMSEVRRAERRMREARKAALNEQVDELCRDIDALKVAAGYVGTYLGNFPSTGGANDDSYYNCFQQARTKARDFVSQSAVAAPGG